MLTLQCFLALYERSSPAVEYSLLVEGGNVWKGDLATARIDQKDVLPTVKFLEKITGVPLVDSIVGSAGRTPTSGDIDLFVDASKHNKNEVAAKLQQWAQQNDRNALVKKSGTSVHFRTPIAGNPRNGYVQADFMFMADAQFARWSLKSPQQSAYKNVHREILLRSVAKALGLRYSWMNGLTSRVTGNVIPGGKDPERIAQVLLGPDAKPENLESVESIMQALTNDPTREEKLADARETLGKEGIKL